jgi:hypothetical protein
MQPLRRHLLRQLQHQQQQQRRRRQQQQPCKQRTRFPRSAAAAPMQTRWLRGRSPLPARRSNTARCSRCRTHCSHRIMPPQSAHCKRTWLLQKRCLHGGRSDAGVCGGAEALWLVRWARCWAEQAASRVLTVLYCERKGTDYCTELVQRGALPSIGAEGCKLRRWSSRSVNTPARSPS